MRRSRVLLVRVAEMSLGDGALAPPRVGAITDFPLAFSEAESPPFSVDSRRADGLMTVRGVLEPDDAGPFEYRDDGTGASWWIWRGLLRGDGWTATWHGRRPLCGTVELTGCFTSTLKIDAGRVRGRITRVHHTDTTTLIDLDLDDVPPPALRPSLVPGDISAAGDALWVADTELPLVARLDTTTNHATEYVLPAGTTEMRRVAATPTGCWVFGTDGLYRVTAGSPAYRVCHGGIADAAASGETLLVHDVEHGWTLHSPANDPIPLAMPEGGPRSIGIDRRSGDFVVALTTRDASGRRLRLVRITTTGTIAVGRPVQPPAPRAQRPFFAGSPPRLFYGGVVSTVDDDLTLGPHERLPTTPVAGGALGDDAWVLTYRSTADLELPWWPLPEPDVPATPLPRIPILTVLESSTLAVKSSWRIDEHRSVTAHPAAVWVTDRDQLYRLPGAPATRRPELVEVAARISESIPPATESECRR